MFFSSFFICLWGGEGGGVEKGGGAGDVDNNYKFKIIQFEDYFLAK